MVIIIGETPKFSRSLNSKYSCFKISAVIPTNSYSLVSGNRDFGFTKNSNGSYTFFTKGVDRLTSLDLTIVQNATGIPFSKADALWTSFQKGVADFVNKNGGNAGASKQEIYRPNWDQVKAVIDGKAPLSSLSTDCK